MNKWTPDFDPTQYVSSAVPVWVRLPHLPLHCWNPKTLETIGSTLGKYIDRAERKDQYSCARICVEVDLELGLPEAINLTVSDWSHIQELNYEQLPFKCRYFHEHGHFTRYYKKKADEEAEKKKINGSGLKNLPRQGQIARKRGKKRQGDLMCQK